MKRNKLILAILAIAASSLLFVIPCTGNRVDASAAQVDREASVQPFLNDVFVVDGGFLRHPDGSTPSDAPASQRGRDTARCYLGPIQERVCNGNGTLSGRPPSCRSSFGADATRQLLINQK
jgi:hypothetical protein